MKARVLKKSDVLREGYIKGLKEAQRIISETIGEQVGNVYHAEMIDATIVEDSYKNGEQPETGESLVWELAFDFTDEQDFFEKLSEQKLIGNDAYADYETDNKRVRVYYLADDEWRPLNSEEYKLWKRGRIKGYSCNMWFNVTIDGRKATDEEMLAIFEEA